MQRLFCLILTLTCVTVAYSQTTKTTVSPKPPTAKPAAPKVLKDLRDSASYTAGIFVVNKYRSQNVYNFNSKAVAKAVNDLQTGKPQLISDADADKAVTDYQKKLLANSSPVINTASTSVALNNLCDSASYAAGIHLVSWLRDFDITNFNSAIITRAIDDLQTRKKPLLNDSLANVSMMRYQYRLQEIKNKSTIDAGKKFLAENKKRPPVKVTKTGLQYEVIKQGTGLKPTKSDKITCHYIGSFIDGTEFENSYKSGNPVSFNVTQVIKGWTEALLMMPVGSKWKIFIPYQLGYGPGQDRAIPGGSVLVFELELLGIAGK